MPILGIFTPYVIHINNDNNFSMRNRIMSLYDNDHILYIIISLHRLSQVFVMRST